MKTVLVGAAVLLTLSACGGDDTEFDALDSAELAAVVDAGFTEESGFRGILAAEDFTDEDVNDFNTLAKLACADLADGLSEDQYAEFKRGVLDGAEGLEEMIDADALTVAIVDATCPSYIDNLPDSIRG